MTKRAVAKDDDGELSDFFDGVRDGWKEPEEVAPVVEPQKNIGNGYYEVVMWNGIMTTHKCIKCGTFYTYKDDMILHVLTHVPQSERDAVLALFLA